MKNAVKMWVYGLLMGAMGLGFVAPAMADDLPANEFVEKFSNEVLTEIKARKKELVADPAKLDALIDQKVMPNVNFRKMTQLVVGAPWRAATPAQRDAIVEQFKILLTKTYAGALSQVGDQTLKVDKLRARPEDTDVVVNSQVLRKDGPPVDLAYRVEKKDGKWKIYDLSVLGLWLVDSYKAQFQPIINQSGVDGLISSLKAKNSQG
ncbi:ABC transporter substrate-binding protein [Limnobacter humi]|uniref:ABC transporter substrate-binding protein n=1 Tax=Limnobacter humi TaxID=1778671 RepID=A0ABT1WKK9_9BURK|nr:ABC transporter substrate-binding protein [Limnobacter humi]MCQ8897457.1 ABC transporter substrate-binding protein [Limnobacter humi]